MQSAIKKAIEGGWNQNWELISKSKNYSERLAFLLDPTFWQALGKQQGWDKYQDIDTTEYGLLHYANGTIFGWQAVWHRFIDHLAEGKDADSFFNSLLK